jgi:DNA modification methylase
MKYLDSNKINAFIKKTGNKRLADEIENEIEKIIVKSLKTQKNKKRIEKINESETKYKISVLEKDILKELPKWVKRQIKDCSVIGSTKKVILLPDGKKYHIDNHLNDLSGGEWSYFLRSVINTRYLTSGSESYAHHLRKIHPSPKPPQLLRDLIKFFTKENELVLDYFMGVGGTLLGASLCNRKALGIDLSKKFINVYSKANKYLKLQEQKTIQGDTLEVLKEKKQINNFLGNKKFSLIAIDPPYGDMMNREKTGEAAKNKRNTEATPFTKNSKDLGNMDFDLFLEKFSETIELSIPLLKENGHYIVFIKDLQPKGKKSNLLHASIIDKMNKIDGINYVGMKIWADESINLYPYGYPYSFVSNQLHQYIMFFKKKTM